MHARYKLFTMFDMQGQSRGLLVVGFVVLFIIILSSYYRYRGPDKPSGMSAFSGSTYEFEGVTKKPVQDVYAVVFDAGSTGSRIHIFQFNSTGKGGSLALVKETFDSIKPGLSAYADDPQKGAESLRGMMNKALAIVPSNLHESTPVTLKATAGLRLLSDKKAEEILQQVRNMFKEYKFMMVTSTHENCAQIMDGVDEGVFSWITINFLLGKLRHDEDTVAALDLGGGSTQLTFTPKEKVTMVQSPKDYIKTIRLFNMQHVLYTHSYLGFGLMSARFELLGGKKQKGKPDNRTVLSSSCLPANYDGSYKYNLFIYKIKGIKKEDSGYLPCLTEAQHYVEHNVKGVQELQKKELYIFSYFYDRAVDASMITAEENLFCERETYYDNLLESLYCKNNGQDMDSGGELRVSDFDTAARKVFDNPDISQPFLAMDLTYIYALLHHGYKLQPEEHVKLKKKINNVEVSWALGAAFHLFSVTGVAR